MFYCLMLFDSEIPETLLYYILPLCPTCGIDAQLQSRGRLRQNELESLSSLWNVVIDDLHLYKLVPFAINKIECLGRERGFRC